jgi:hypothetical protein
MRSDTFCFACCRDRRGELYKGIATAKELLKDGYRIQQLSDALRGRSVQEKSEMWITGKIRELLGVPELPADRRIDEHDLNEQAWLVTRRPKEITTTTSLRTNVEKKFRENGFDMQPGARLRVWRSLQSVGQ